MTIFLLFILLESFPPRGMALTTREKWRHQARRKGKSKWGPGCSPAGHLGVRPYEGCKTPALKHPIFKCSSAGGRWSNPGASFGWDFIRFRLFFGLFKSNFKGFTLESLFWASASIFQRCLIFWLRERNKVFFVIRRRSCLVDWDRLNCDLNRVFN